jgi:hypothetical protein
MRRKLLAVVVAAFVCTSGIVAVGAETVVKAAPEEAVEAPRRNPIAAYFVNRGKDLLDVFNLKLTLGDAGSILFHARATRLAQIGFGRFAGTKVGFDGPCAGLYGEGRVEYGLSVFYWAWIGRKTNPAGITEEAEKRNWFFGRVDDIKAGDTYREFYDANRPWHTIGGAVSLPFLPGLEAELNPAEAVDFVLSFFGVRGFRVPPPFYKVDNMGERVPAAGSMRWHGQEEFEQYD